MSFKLQRLSLKWMVYMAVYCLQPHLYRCRCGGMVDTLVLGTSATRRAGSSPVTGTSAYRAFSQRLFYQMEDLPPFYNPQERTL